MVKIFWLNQCIFLKRQSTMDYEIRYLNSEEYALWDDFIDQSEQGSIYSKSYWLQAISDITNQKFRILCILDNGYILGGIGFCVKKNILGEVINRPILTPYNGVIIKKSLTKYPSKITSDFFELVNPILNKIKNDKYAKVTLYNRTSINDIRIFVWNGWEAKIRYTYEIPIFDLSRLIPSLAHNIRKQIRKCEESAIQVSSYDDINTFYKLFKSSFDRQNISTPINKDDFIKLYTKLRAFSCCKMYFAHLNSGKPISARIELFTEDKMAHDWVAGADPDYLKTGATSYLLWKVIEDLSNKGYKYLDLNGANIKTIARFKSEFGGDLLPYYVTSRNYSKILRFLSLFKTLFKL